MTHENEYVRLFKKAQNRGWKLPSVEDCFLPETWFNYWKQCEAYEQNPEAGRPVVPHRSA